MANLSLEQFLNVAKRQYAEAVEKATDENDKSWLKDGYNAVCFLDKSLSDDIKNIEIGVAEGTIKSTFKIE